jgi:hypothetical protein
MLISILGIQTDIADMEAEQDVPFFQFCWRGQKGPHDIHA